MNTNKYIYYRQLGYPSFTIKTAEKASKDSSSDKKYTEDEFNDLVKQYEDSKRYLGGYEGPYESVFAAKRDKKQGKIDKVNANIRKNKRRASGYRTYYTGLGGGIGFGAGSLLSHIIGLDHGEEVIDPSTGKVSYKPRTWRRALGDWGLRGTGFLLGGFLPHVGYRMSEGLWDTGANMLSGPKHTFGE